MINFEKWLVNFDKVWQEADAKGAAKLFTETVIYFENPLDPPLISRKEVEKIWSDVAKTQKNINVKSEVYMTDKNTCVAHFRGNFYRVTSSTLSQLDGIYIFTLNDENLCEEFHFWWVGKEEKV